MPRLIGGIEGVEGLRRDVVLGPLDGAAEVALAELADTPLGLPEQVTAFLALTVARIGDSPCDAALAADLCVGDRQHLVRQIGARMGRDLVWLGGDCADCGEAFEIPVRQSELPAKPAGDGYPSARVRLDAVMATVRPPTGADQAAIAGLDSAPARAVLLSRLVDGIDTATLSEADANRLEDAIEALSPEVALQAQAACPECGAELLVEVDPYLTLSLGGQEIFTEVHTLARHYHWSEAEILALPQARRRIYLRLIDRARGMVSRPEPGAFH